MLSVGLASPSQCLVRKLSGLSPQMNKCGRFDVAYKALEYGAFCETPVGARLVS